MSIPISASTRKMQKTFISVLTMAGILLVMAGSPGVHAQGSDAGNLPGTPDKPTGNAIWVGMVDLEWNEIPGADSYDVQYFHVSSWIDLPAEDEDDDLDIDIAFYGAGVIVNGLSHSGSYTFRVRAVNSHGASEWSEYGWIPQTDRPSAWVDVPEPTNVPATGEPAVSGRLNAGELLAADVSGISDDNGLDRVRFYYQWISSDGTTDTDIEGATGASYSLTEEDEGKTIEVRVSFTDRQGFTESSTSLATGVVSGATTSAAAAETNEETTSNANNPPEFPGATTTRSVAENSDTSTLIGLPVAAADSEETSLTYSIEGEAADALTVDAAGQLRVAEGAVLDHESRPTLIGTVTATDSVGATASIEVTVSVTDVWDPNVVLIMADDVGPEIFGAYGGTHYYTPEIDAIANGGVLFTNAHANPCCDGSRLEFMTGKSNVRNYPGPNVAPPSEYTFIDLFREGGYRTGAAGKWGFNSAEPGQNTHPSDKFDESCMWNTSETEADQDQPGSTNRYWEPRISCNGELRALESDDFGPDIFVSFLMDFIADNQDRPFFAYYPMVLAHKPYVPMPNATTIDDDTLDQIKFESMVWYLDRNVGLLHDKLSELGLLDNTVLMFTSDNATHPAIQSTLNGTSILGGEKATTLDRGTRVPLIAHVPGSGGGGRVLGDLVSLTDMLPTLADATGLTVPNRGQLDGVSFWERLQGKPGQPRKWIYTYYFPNPFAPKFDHPQSHPPAAWTRDHRYKLYHTGELFDIIADPFETRPLSADDTTSSANRTTLQEALDSMPSQGQAIDWSRVIETWTAGRHRWRPALSSAVVHDAELTLNYVDWIMHGLTPPTDSYSVLVDGSARDVVRVRVESHAVRLTLASAVTADQTVTVSYTPGRFAVRKVMEGQHFQAESFAAAPVRNETASPNAVATGAPMINGVVQVGEALNADTSNIADADGLEDATFGFQWVRSDGSTDADIQDATSSTYTLSDDDEGKTVKLRVSFTDDAGNEETLTSEVTAAVEVRANSPSTGAPTISGAARVGETLTADTSGIADEDGLTNAAYFYQWLAGDGASETDIAGATSVSYALSDDEEGKNVKLRVSFTDDAGNEETLTSEATAAVGAAAGKVVWESELTVGRELQVFPDALGYSVSGDNGGTLSPDHFEIDGTVYSVQFLLRFAGGLWLGIDRELPVEFTLVAGESTYEGSESKVPVTGSGSGGYWWPSAVPGWSEEESVQVSLSIQPREPAGSREKAPLIADLRDIPPGHDGQGTFTFELRFSEEPEPDFSYKTLRDSAFTVTSGKVENARRLNKPSNIRWEITVRPDGNGEVTIILPATTDCEAEGAICAGDGRMLFNRIELTVAGPGG